MAKAQLDINVEHITRVEGHGNIRVNVRNGILEECKLEITESPRYFEAMLLGKPWYQVNYITCRICGICSVGHTSASLQATEDAFGIEISDQTRLLRKLNLDGETLQSHILHVLFLVAPDLFGKGSVIPLATEAPEVVKMALRMKNTANALCEMIGGRHVHPIASVVNGFTHLPSKKEMEAMRKRLEVLDKDLDTTAELLLTKSLPQFERKTEYIALKRSDEYAFLEGQIASTESDELLPPQNYKDRVKEYLVDHSSAKHADGETGAYMVGALARVNTNYNLLRPKAKKVAEAFGLKVPCYNPFMNNIAQVVESVHCCETAIEILDKLMDRGLQVEPIEVKPRAGRGVGAVEVPRGILFHEYIYDDEGRITDANCIIPTGQNYANIELDMKALVPQILDKPKEEIQLLCEMLVRAYDPCISCSTHLLDVEFVE